MLERRKKLAELLKMIKTTHYDPQRVIFKPHKSFFTYFLKSVKDVLSPKDRN